MKIMNVCVEIGTLVNKDGKWQVINRNGRVWKTFATKQFAINYLRTLGYTVED